MEVGVGRVVIGGERGYLKFRLSGTEGVLWGSSFLALGNMVPKGFASNGSCAGYQGWFGYEEQGEEERNYQRCNNEGMGPWIFAIVGQPQEFDVQFFGWLRWYYSVRVFRGGFVFLAFCPCVLRGWLEDGFCCILFHAVKVRTDGHLGRNRDGSNLKFFVPLIISRLWGCSFGHQGKGGAIPLLSG